jgi:hypothetical protein
VEPRVDLYCPGALASALRIERRGDLFQLRVTVTVRLALSGQPQPMSDRAIEAALSVSMAELTTWPMADEAVRRADGTRLKLPRLDARLRLYRAEGRADPLQDLPLEVEALAIDRTGAMADAGLGAQCSVSDAHPHLLAVVGVALGGRSIAWPARDQVLAEHALDAPELYTTLPERKAVAAAADPPTLDEALVKSDHALPARPEPPPPSLPRRAAAPPAPRKPASSPPPPPRRAPAPDERAAPKPPVAPAPEPAPAAVEAAEEAFTGTVTISAEEARAAAAAEAVAAGAVHIANRTALAAWVVPWQLRGKHSLTIVLKASCDLGPGGVQPRTAPPAARGDAHLDDDPAATLLYPSDHALLKHRTDVVLIARAHAAGGWGTRADVAFRFGTAGNGFERRALVLGPREWRDGVPSPPRPFRSIPLVYERAFGGPGFARNPVGVGYGSSHHGRFVPSVEDPVHLLARRGEEVRPMAFAAVSPSWEERWSKAGSTGRGRLEEQWHTLPDDFDWEHFQVAPRAQQLDYLVGDEAFEVAGVRPDGEPVRGQLPRLAPRCRAQGVAGAREVPLRIDTVVVDTVGLEVHLLWRGLVSVSSPDAPEVRTLTIS